VEKLYWFDDVQDWALVGTAWERVTPSGSFPHSLWKLRAYQDSHRRWCWSAEMVREGDRSHVDARQRVIYSTGSAQGLILAQKHAEVFINRRWPVTVRKETLADY